MGTFSKQISSLESNLVSIKEVSYKIKRLNKKAKDLWIIDPKANDLKKDYKKLRKKLKALKSNYAYTINETNELACFIQPVYDEVIRIKSLTTEIQAESRKVADKADSVEDKLNDNLWIKLKNCMKEISYVAKRIVEVAITEIIKDLLAGGTDSPRFPSSTT